MEEFTQDELADIVQAMSQKKPTEDERGKIPLRPQGNYKKITKLGFSPINGETPRPLAELTGKELTDLENLKAHVEVVFGKATLSLKELSALEAGSLLPLADLCDDLVDIHVNGLKVGRGEVVAVDGHFGVKIISFTKS